MGELGDAAPSIHAELGEFARRAGADRLLALGSMSSEAVRAFGEGAAHYGDVEQLITALRSMLDGSTTVLVKGSRFMRMERIVKALTDETVSSAAGGS